MMQHPGTPSLASPRSPYREPPGGRVTPTRVHYRPGWSLGTFLFLALVSLGLAQLARAQLPGQQRVVSCTTVAYSGVERCTAWDRVRGDVRRLPCGEAQAILDAELSRADLLSQPIITVVSTVSQVQNAPIPTVGNFIGGLRTAVFPRAVSSSASDARVAAAWDAIDRPADGTLPQASARALLAVCAKAPAAEAEHRTVALMLVPRDDRAAAALLLLGLLAFGLLASRGAAVAIDPESGEARITERLGPFTTRSVRLALGQIAAVAISTRARGLFAGRCVELVLLDGSRVPLLSAHAPSGLGPHEQAARALREGLGHPT